MAWVAKRSTRVRNAIRPMTRLRNVARSGCSMGRVISAVRGVIMLRFSQKWAAWCRWGRRHHAVVKAGSPGRRTCAPLHVLVHRVVQDVGRNQDDRLLAGVL